MNVKEFLSLTNISWKAKGIGLAIATNPDIFTNPDRKDKINILASMGLEQGAAVSSSIRELEQVGILRRETVRNQEGRTHVKGSVWTIDLSVNS